MLCRLRIRLGSVRVDQEKWSLSWDYTRKGIVSNKPGYRATFTPHTPNPEIEQYMVRDALITTLLSNANLGTPVYCEFQLHHTGKISIFIDAKTLEQLKSPKLRFSFCRMFACCAENTEADAAVHEEVEMKGSLSRPLLQQS